jgi:hypothetical protein
MIIVSHITPADPKQKWEKFYTKDTSLADAMKEAEAGVHRFSVFN